MQAIKQLYKIGFGPSSSHTIAPYRIAQFYKNSFPNCDNYKIIWFELLIKKKKERYWCMHVLRNDQGITKTVKDGVSWTFFFFGCLVPLFRGDWKWFLLSLVATFVTFGLSNFVFMFKYNEWYRNDLLERGYRIIE